VPGQEEQYLIRGQDGRMATVLARSIRGAVRLYLQKHRPPKGDIIRVKPRGQGDWAEYKVY
jgi:hypothetical protein